MKVSRVAEMRAMDQAAVEQFGIAEELLMENAGHAAYTVLQRQGDLASKTCLVVCGAGNNGGDGLVVARKLLSHGAAVQVCMLGDPDKYHGAARLNFDIVSRLPIAIRQLDAAEPLAEHLARADVIIDAIFGTGLTREVVGRYADAIALINDAGKTVLSLDIASGIQGDTGKVMGTAVQADCTVTFGLPKVGNLVFPGADYCGTLFVSHISFPPSLYDSDSLKIAINQPPPLPPRDTNAHKGTFGQVLCIAGAASYFGAPYFSALAVLRAGGGYCRLAAPAAMIPFLANKGSEIVFVPQQETASGSIALANQAALLELIERMDMVILGPGISLDDETQQLARDLIRDIRKPLLLDGDGITALCQDLSIIQHRQAETIVTPHLGEMSRLTGVSVRDLAADRVEILQRTAKELQAIIVLKGAHSLIGYPDERVYINTSGNSGMATAGSGDVLTGTIAAMYGLGLSIQDAVRKGVFIHGLAGDLAAEAHGEDGITAQTILDSLPQALRLDRVGLPQAFRERYVGARKV
jgi:hydroxyethylthiazole kinase-like uncharacterized protein yjeF